MELHAELSQFCSNYAVKIKPWILRQKRATTGSGNETK